MRFGADTPGRQFRENSRERGRRSPAGGLQGSEPPSPSTDFARAKRESGGRRARPTGWRHTFRRGAARGERARADGGVQARGSSRTGRWAARAWRGGTLARHGRYGGLFDGAGKPGGSGPSRGNGCLSGCDAGNRAAGGAPGWRRGLLSVRGGWRGARRAGAGGTRAGGARRRGGAAGTADGNSSGGVCRVSPHVTAVVPPGRRVFFEPQAANRRVFGAARGGGRRRGRVSSYMRA